MHGGVFANCLLAVEACQNIMPDLWAYRERTRLFLPISEEYQIALETKRKGCKPVELRSLIIYQ